SCRECHRLKIKCDRVWPCSTCRKRGFADICPDGVTIYVSVLAQKNPSVDVPPVSEIDARTLAQVRERCAAPPPGLFEAASSMSSETEDKAPASVTSVKLEDVASVKEGESREKSEDVEEEATEEEFLAQTYAVLALGTLYTSPSAVNNPRRLAHAFFVRADLCLQISRYTWHSSLYSVITLILMAQYSISCARLENSHFAWNAIGTAVRLATSMGLHRDGEVFQLTPYELHIRRLVWRELLFFDRLQCLGLGRPYSISSSQTNVYAPSNINDIEIMPDSPFIPEPVDMNTRTDASFTVFKSKLSPVLALILDRAFRFKPSSYTVVKELTEKIREVENDIPLWAQNLNALDESLTHSQVMEAHSMHVLVQQIYLYLHRPWFVLAITKPEDRSKYQESITICTQQSHALVMTLCSMLSRVPPGPCKWWVFRFHSLNAGVIQGSYALCFPKNRYAFTAFEDLQYMCQIFEHIRGTSSITAKDLKFMVQLKDRVYHTLQMSSQGLSTLPSLDDIPFLHFNTPSSRNNSQSPKSVHETTPTEVEDTGIERMLPPFEQENPMLFNSTAWRTGTTTTLQVQGQEYYSTMLSNRPAQRFPYEKTDALNTPPLPTQPNIPMNSSRPTGASNLPANDSNYEFWTSALNELGM
ncbi:transcription factor, partial [Schizosaccharomyces japonicus yFS275]